MSRLEPPTVTLPLGRRAVRVDTGELLFPGIALVFCVLYYADTRGLPEQSLLYAEPLLYATAILAVTTMVSHGFVIEEREHQGPPSSAGGDETPGGPGGDGPGDHTGDRTTAVDGATDPDGLSLDESSRVDSPEVMSTAKTTQPDATAAVEEEREQGAGGRFDLRTASGLTVLSVGYILSLYVTTFVVSSMLFLAASLYLFGERRPLRILAYSVGFTLLVWGVFVQWLMVPLP